MAEIIRMPLLSDTMTEGVIEKWNKKVGDTVKSDDAIAEIQTDKATMEVIGYVDGTLLYIGVEEGKAAKVNDIIAIIGKAGEDFAHLLEQKPATSVKAVVEENVSAAPLPSVTPESLGVTVIRMPLLSDTMTEGVIEKWNKKVGDTVKSDDALADVQTDKATMEVMGYADGTLLYIGVEEGKAAKVNDIIAIVGKAGTDVSALLNQPQAGSSAPVSALSKQDAGATKAAAPVVASATADGGRIKASPLAKVIAHDKGIDLTAVKGSAVNGRIVKKDVLDALENQSKGIAQPAPAAVAAGAPVVSAPVRTAYGMESFEEVNVTQMRKTIARRLSESLFTAPHFYLTMSINMDKAMELRKTINDISGTKISFNDLVLKATAVALKKHPKINSSWLGDKIRYNQHVNIGVAVAVEDGLLVPVVRLADTKSLSAISKEVKDYAQRAKDKKLQPADWEGSTFTISNLGMYGIDEFTAIINPPDACILAVGGINQVPVVKDGAVVPGNVMKVTLSCDHRVVDGAMGAEFLQTLKGLLEEPIRLMV